MNRLDSRELYEWMAFEAVIGPIGLDRQDYYNAKICHTLYMTVWDGKGEPPEMSDHMPPWVDKKAPVTDKQDTHLRMQADSIFGAIARSFDSKEKIGSDNNHATPYKTRI